MLRLTLALALALAAGCAVFEHSPQEVQRKLAEPTTGQLYERDPLEGY
jgi:hypothetical protein